jgi:DNA-binding MarR family transcriptional regulator
VENGLSVAALHVIDSWKASPLDNMCDNTYYSVVTTVRTLQEELKQRKPFQSLEEEAFLNIARTYAVLEHALAQALKPYDITPTQYNVLRILRGAGAEGLCRNEVGERLVRRVPDVTRLLDRMEEMGLVDRVRGGEDRRYVTARITRQGLSVLERLDQEICRIHRSQLGHLDRKMLRSIINLLTAIRGGQQG